MKKTELIHLHSLLGRVAMTLQEEGVLTGADLDAYRDLDTSPMKIRASRAEHERAALTLSKTLATALEEVVRDGTVTETRSECSDISGDMPA